MIYDSISHQYFRGRRISLISSSHACTIINLWQISIMLMYHNSFLSNIYQTESITLYFFHHVFVKDTTRIWIPISVMWNYVETYFYSSPTNTIILLKFHCRHTWPKTTPSDFIPHDISAHGTVNRQIIFFKYSNLGIVPKLVEENN